MAAWRDAERRARATIDQLLDTDEAPFDGRVVRDVLAVLPDGAHLLVASSLPVRDLEWFGAPRAGVTVHANRGVNGIDGLVSTAAGVAAGSGGPTVALLGDLALLHDSNGLLGLVDRGIDLTLVIVDNDGGGIFSFLPPADALASDEFERLFGTPHGRDLAALLAVHDVPVAAPTTAVAVVEAVRHAVDAGGVHAVLVRTDRAENVARHRAVWDALAARR
jgi:2-succinyl-5-enolpyruvyl-6-hydroxy-3-cyclohexene-1-carboxylate synthase